MRLPLKQQLTLKKLIKELEFQTPLARHFFPQYLYNFTPAQLGYLCRCVDLTRLVPGAIAEVGCSIGSTTLFLNKHMDAEGIDKRYYAVDTFSGFVSDDVDVEVSKRGKKKDFFVYDFQINKRKWFDATMRRGNVSRVQSIQADVNDFDLRELGKLCFVLLDVDLYRPMRKCLTELYENLSEGGMIVVDDCSLADTRWDGALQAYREFMQEIGQPLRVVHGKLGIIERIAKLQSDAAG